MSISSYISDLRKKIGNDLLLLPSVAAVIMDSEGKILLQEKAGGEAWSLPAGGIEPGESPQQAVIREVLEETGLHVSVERILGVVGGADFRYQYPNNDVVEYTGVIFRCRVIGVSVPPCDSETVSVEYFSEQNMPRLALPYPMDLLFGRASHDQW